MRATATLLRRLSLPRLMARRRSRPAPDAALLRQAELRAERVVSFLRIGVTLGLLLVFALSVGRPAAGFEDYLRRQLLFAVLAMLAYLALGALILWLVRSGRFRRWMIWPVVTADCLFMLINTWAGLETVSLPGSLIFVLPPTWLVPVVLAYAVLRFNPYLQLYCTALIVTGLALLTFETEVIAAEDLARRVEHMVANPPNLVRLVMIALAGVVLAVAAFALRQLLHRSLLEAEARLTLTRYLPERLAARLTAQKGALEDLRQGTRVEMGVVFIDICGFTAWSETRDPAEVGALITEFRGCVTRAAGACGGMVDKFIGDAAMLLFEPGEGEGKAAAARRALAATLRLSEEISDFSSERVKAGQAPLRVGIGLHWGEVYSSVVGCEERLEYTVLGDTVNVAARLEQFTRETGMEIILSEAALLAAGVREPAREGWSALPAVQLRGRNATITVFGRGQGANNEPEAVPAQG